ncbi:neprilysin-like [Lytechinus pictus]|uniref:neprilysin-like n=1 Tax=Lytechinus pictus TaxID=7653 RepID=UPI0030B9EDB7
MIGFCERQAKVGQESSDVANFGEEDLIALPDFSLLREENLTGIPSPDSVADSPCLRPSLSNGHCAREATTFTFPVQGDQRGVPEVKTANPFFQRTRLEKRLIILAVILAACSVTMVTILFVQWHTRRSEQSHTLRHQQYNVIESFDMSGINQRNSLSQSTDECTEICTSPNCVASAARLISNMDPHVDPCEDFYEYSCGGWHRSNVIPEDDSHYAVPSQLKKNLEIQCKELIERTPPPSETEAIRKARDFYKSCMNEEVLTQRGIEPLTALIRKLGGWPVLNDGVYDERTWRLEDVLATSRMILDRNFLFFNRISVDAADSNSHIMTFDQPNLGLQNRDYYLRGNSIQGLKAYEKYMIDMTLYVRGGNDVENVTSEMQEVLEFEKKMANISMTPTAKRGAQLLNQKVSVSYLKRRLPTIDWTRYFQLVLNKTDIDHSMELVVYSPQYLLGLNRIVQETPNRTIANYLVWRAVIYTMDLMNSKARSIRQTFHKVVSGEKRQPAKWKQCIENTNSYMSRALGALFVLEKFDVESKKTALTMIGHLRNTQYNILNTTDWMDDVTKQKALQKAYAIREQIGYEEKLLNFTYLDGVYERINITVDKYFENAVQIMSEHARKLFAKLDEKVDRYEWSTVPLVVNAYYQFSSNVITFPAAILQPPYFSSRHSRSMNYGGIGVVIGHELTHAFDDKGRHFDIDGNLGIWWTNSSSESFRRKTQCLIDQYSSYQYEDLGMNIDGLRTLGENIADNGGLKEAFMAYRHSVEAMGKEEPLLPGINLTHNQIFFLSFGQLWCGLHRDQDRINGLKNDYHSPLKFRVWGSVSNSEDFAKAFNCPVGSPMNPRNKCGVW